MKYTICFFQMKSQTLLTLSAVLILLIHACNEPQESSTTSISFSIEGYGRDTIRLFQIEPLGFARINTQELIVDESGDIYESKAPEPDSNEIRSLLKEAIKLAG